jgi:carbamoyltransferase
MIILGISYTGGHDSSAALVRDGSLVAAAEEERFSRRKHDGDFPLKAVEYCLSAAGVELSDVDLLAFPDLPFRFGRDSYVAEMEWALVRRQVNEGPGTWRHLVHRALAGALRATGVPVNLGMNEYVRSCLDALETRFGSLPPLYFCEHHRAHAASVYLTSGETSAGVMTCDGVGGPYSTVTWAGEGAGLRRLDAELYPNSLGHFYMNVTGHLGLGEWSEGKTMGLAPYGDAARFGTVFRDRLGLQGARWYRYDQRDLGDTLGFPSRRSEPILAGPYADAAAGAQDALQAALLRIAASSLRGERTLCLSGGVALNCSANGMLRRSGVAETVWAFPAAGDAGLSVGAALLAASEAGEIRPRRLEHAYWGPEYPDTALEAALRAEPRLRFHRAPDVAGETAALIAGGGIVGWFQGRMEFGPRALGNRSILADPRSVEMRDQVNRLKGREQWRPLAPSVLLEQASDYFELTGESPFMLFATQVRRDRQREIPAVTHVDGSARPQTVSASQNPRFHALISAFERISGIPVLMNTSFNGAWEPVVASPEDAVRTFIACGLDALVLGDYVASRHDLPKGERPGASRPVVV